MISSSLDYDPFEDITTILSAKESLNDINKLIHATRHYKLDLEAEILEGRRQEEESVEKLKETTFDFNKIFQEIEETRTFSASTQSTISQLTEGISHLDNAKRNLTQCMTLFQNLKILTDSYVGCSTLLARDSYKESASSFKIMCSLAENTFKPYKSVDEINKLLTSIARLRADTFDRIKQSYNKVLSGKVPEGDILEVELREGACDLLDSDLSGKSQTIDWCINKLLYEIGEIFKVDDEAGSLENLSRRYIFFKKVLNNFNSNYARFFPSEWEMPLKLTTSFYKMTRKDSQILLKKEFRDKSPSIDLFMGALQATLDFEKYIDVRFSNKLKESKLSVCFEPYLSLWVSHQDKMMNEKFLSYMSSGDIGSNLSESLVLPSSADLFRTYRSVLSQTFELIENNTNEGILLALANFFTKWLTAYSNKILKPLLLPDEVEIQNKEETIKYTVALINTADYCSTTVDQLEEKLLEYSTDSDTISKAFVEVKNMFAGLLAKSNNILLNRILPLDLAFVWKEFNNMDWAHVLVEDYGRYMVTLKNVLCFTTADDSSNKKSTLELIISQYNRDVYGWNFLDKVVDLITHDFSKSIIRLLQPLPPYATLNNPRKFEPKSVVNIGEQLLLDTELLKQILHSLPENVSNDSAGSQSIAFKRVQRHIDTNLEKLLQFIKLLIAPLDSADDYYETFKQLTENNLNTSVWAFLLSLKGMPWDLSSWKQHWSAYDLDSDEQGDSDTKSDLFIFKWNLKLLQQFEFNMARVNEPAWAKFIKNDLKISPPSRTPSRIQVANNTHQHPQQQQQQVRSPVMNVKNLVSNARFFNRGG